MNIVQNKFALRKENLSYPTDDLIKLFRNLFFKHATGHISQMPGKSWVSFKHPPSDQDIIDHFTGKKWIGPRYIKRTSWTIIDLDNKTLEQAYEIISIIKAITSNSMLSTSVSPGGFHLDLFVSPIDSPISTDLVQSAFETYPKELICGVFPKLKQGIRAPFGRNQNLVYEAHQHLITPEDKLNCLINQNIFNLNNLQPYDHKNLELFPDIPRTPRHHVTPVNIDLSPIAKPRISSFRYSEKTASDLISIGLPGPGTRDMAITTQFIDQYRQGFNLVDSIRFVSDWISEHHNRHSKEYNSDPGKVLDDIPYHGKRIFDHFKKLGILPEDIHCSEREFIAEAFISFALDYCNGNWPRVKFYTECCKYYSSRNHRELIRFRWDRFAIWSNTEIYLKYLDDLEIRGGCTRGTDYRHYKYSKYLMLNLPEVNPSDAILFNGRPAKSLEEAIVATRTRAEARHLLKDKGFTRKNAERITRDIYNKLGTKTEAPVRSTEFLFPQTPKKELSALCV